MRVNAGPSGNVTTGHRPSTPDTSIRARQHHAELRAQVSAGDPRRSTPPLALLHNTTLVAQSESSPPRLAACLTGVVTHGMPGSYPISDARQLQRLKEWAHTIRGGGVHLDWFAHQELAEYPPRAKGHEADPVLPVGSPGVRSAQPALLAEFLTTLAPVKLSLHHEEKLCVARPAFCAASHAWPRWFEQQLKTRRALDLVGEYERETGRRYDWVILMRNDYNVNAPGHFCSAPDVLRVVLGEGMARSRAGASSTQSMVRFKPYFADGMVPSATFGQADWFWLADRTAAEHVASLVNASTAWMRCMRGTAPGNFMANERLLVEWTMHGGYAVAKMPSRQIVAPSLRSRAAQACDVYGHRH